MSNMKQELIKAAGDLTESKKRVMAGVESRRQNPRKKMPKFIPAIATAVVILIIGVFVGQLVNKESAQGMERDDILTFYQAQIETFEFDSLEAKNRAMDQYLSDVEILTYGAAKEISVTDAEKQEIVDTHLGVLPEEIRSVLVKKLEEKGFTMQDYERFVFEHIGLVGATKKQLLAMYQEKYTGFDEMVLNNLIAKDATKYLEENHPEKIAELSELMGYRIGSSIGSFYKGVVLAVEDHAFLFTSGYVGKYSNQSTPFHNSDSGPLHWIPKREGWDVEVGDRVKLNISTSFQSDEPQGTYNPVAISGSLEPITDEIVQFNIASSNHFDQWQKTIDWATQEVEFNSEPIYRFHIDNQTYDGWLTPDKQWLELYDSASRQYAKVRVEKFAMLMEAMIP